jgi:hypothetical protein
MCLPFALALLAAGAKTTTEAKVSPASRDSVWCRRQARSRTALRAGPPLFCDWGEFLIDTSVVRVSAPGDQESPAIAFDGVNSFVAWQDDRSGTCDIMAARITNTGEVVDTTGIQVSAASGDQTSPTVAFGGTVFLVVWEDWRAGSGDIYCARVSPDGVVLDPGGVAVSTATGDQTAPDVAFDGSQFLVVWQDGRNGPYDVYGARVSLSCAVLDSTGIPLSMATNDQVSPAVTSDGTNCVAVWEDERGNSADVYGTRISQSGVVLDTAGFAVSRTTYDQCSPDIAFDGSNFMVAWQDDRTGEFYDIYAARVARDGVLLDTAGILVCAAADDQCVPDITFDGTCYCVAWQDWRSGDLGDIYGARVTPAGTVLDPSGIAVSRARYDQDQPGVAAIGSGMLVVWQDDRDGSTYDIYGARVTQAGTVLDTSGVAVCGTTNEQWFPAMDFDGSNFLVVWEDGRGSGYDIHGSRVTPTGIILDPEGISIAATATMQHDPEVGFDGTNYLVVWEDSRSGAPFDLYGTRVGRDGVVLDTSSFVISGAANGQWEPSIAFDGTNYLVVWSDLRRGPFDVYGARVTRSGTVLDPTGFIVSAAAGDQWYPDVVFDGTNYLVVWADKRSGSTWDVYGARVSPDGVVLDPAGFAISAAARDQRFPVLAFDGTNSLVVWADSRGGASTGIWAARVSAGGTVLDPAGIELCGAGSDPWYPAVAFDGTNYIAVWTDWRAGSHTEIYGASVAPSGLVADTFPVIQQEGNQWSGALGAATGGQVLLAYAGWAGKFGGRTYGTHRVWGKLGPFPGLSEGSPSPLERPRVVATIVRRVLTLPCPAVPGVDMVSSLHDASGRRVVTLSPGPNDVSHLTSGVYFLYCSENDVVQKVILNP